MVLHSPRYTVFESGFQISCLPTDLDTVGFIDITTITDRYRKYLNPFTGEIHDSEVYYKHLFKISEK